MEKGLPKAGCNILKIAVTGPESTGKTTLAQNLAAHYQTVWNPEYAREYLDKISRLYTAQDIEDIAAEQLKKEESLVNHANGIYIADTELTVIKVWMEHKFGNCPQWILDKLAVQDYDIYFLCNIDIPWEPDPQREHPDLRDFFLDIYLREMEKSSRDWFIISGDEESRLNQAIEIVDKMKEMLTNR